MEEAWRAKCSPAWRPLPASSPLAATPLPALPRAPPAPPPSSGNQMDRSSGQLLHPFGPDTNFAHSIIFQEPNLFNTLNLDSCKSGEADNSFLDLLSGHTSRNFLQLSSSTSKLATLHVQRGDIVSNSNYNVPITNSPSPAKNHRNGVQRIGEFYPFVASCSLPPSTNASSLHNDFLVEASKSHVPNSGNRVPHQTFRGNKGVEVSSGKHGWPTSSSPLNASQQHVLNHPIQEVPWGAKPSPSRTASNFVGRPRVFCMNRVGELFLSEMGLLGVVCLCHEIPMSVAKFCEHSGSPSANPGDAVHLENGMTLAQWRALCFGVMSSDNRNGWEWSGGSQPEGGFPRPKFNTASTLSKDSAPVGSIETFGVLGRYAEHRNIFALPNQTDRGPGQSVLEKAASKATDNTHHMNLFPNSAKSTMPVLSRNQMAQAMKGNPVWMSFDGSNLTANKGKENVGSHSTSNNACYMNEMGKHPIESPCSGFRNSFICENDMRNGKLSSGMNKPFSYSRGNFSCEASATNQGGVPSNIELRLGHTSGPSQNSQTFVRCFAEEIHPPQLSAACNLQNRSSYQHLTLNNFPKETKEPILNLQCSPSDSQSLSTRQTQNSFRNNSSRLPDAEDPMVDATKSSLISFLSHLNTGEKSPLQSTNISGNNNEYFMNDSLYTRPNISDLMRGMPGVTEMKSKTNESKLLNERNQGKRSKFSDSSSSITVKPSYLVYKKDSSDASGLASVVGGDCFHKSSMLDQKTTLHLNQQSGILQTAPQCRNSSQNIEASFQGNKGPCSHATPRYTTPVPSTTAVTDCPVSLDATNSIFMSKPNPSLLYNKNSDRTKNLKSDSLRSFSSRDVAQLSKSEQSALSLGTSTQPGRLYSRTDIEKRNVSQGGLTTNEVLREGPFCFTSKEAQHFAVGSGYPFSNHRSAGDSQMLAAMPGTTNPHNCYNCTVSPQIVSLCSEEHGIQFCGRQVHHSHEQNCVRLEGVSSNSFTGNAKHWRCNQKEESSSFSGKCCCFVPKYLTGCCFSGHDNPCSSLNEHVCRKTMQANPTYTREHMSQDSEQVRLGQCACLRNHTVMQNDYQMVFRRDVPSKLIGHCGSTSTKMPAHVLQNIRIVGDNPAPTAVKDLDGTCQEFESMKEQQMSNVSSGSSAPVVTDVSVEVNNVVSLATDVESAKFVRNSVVDEGSGIEKCSSSDEVLDSRVYEEYITFRNKVNPVNSFGNLIDELGSGKLSSTKRSGNHPTAGFTSYKNTKAKQLKHVLKSGKRNGTMNIPDLSVSQSPNHVGQSLYHFSSQQIDPPPCSDTVTQETCTLSCRPSSVKKKRSTLSSTKTFSLEGLQTNQKAWECNNMQPFDEDPSLGIQEVSAGRKAKQDLNGELEKQFAKGKKSYAIDGKPPKYVSLSCIGNSVNHGVDSPRKKLKPMVCGNSGIISSGMDVPQKPAKFISLSLILKKSSGCNTPEYTGESEENFASHNKKICPNTDSDSCNAPSTWKVQHDNEDSCVGQQNPMDSIKLIPGKNKKYSKKRSRHMPGLSIMRSEADSGSNKTLKSGLHLEGASSRSKARCKGTRMSSLSKITGTVKPMLKSHSLPEHGENDDTNMTEAGNQMKTSASTVNGETFIGNELHNDSCELLRCASSSDVRLVNNSLNDQDHESKPGEGNTRSSSKGPKCLPFLSDSDAFCCVCGSSNREDINNLLECNRCLIKVHQACYGVSKVPKGHWYCRPCKTNSLGIVCVLCGYGGGAMTRAVKSGSIVKNLLKAWKVGTGSNTIDSVPISAANNEFVKSSSVGEASECDILVPGVGSSINTEAFFAGASKMDSEDIKVNNSITAGAIDQSVTQWVHMVCGLWTPGTRCPNVDTMSAFDVSGALSAKKNNVCSICTRPGGSSIQCRVPNCSVHFHPWCAHQKGLLQSEIEGDDNEKVGFYGRCMLHATHSSFHPQCNTADVDIGSSTRDWTCARTEGFKGRKRDQGFNPYHHKPSGKVDGCIVSQEQINAWLHINGQRPCIRGVAKPQFSDTEYDTRKEYARYKQLKSWKRLIVYKSGIHGLGLYTSQYIARGAMVVEYVGEIVGPHVADKREVEYQSGRRLQYKSACYFFRIDTEHIIDATRKGGIARFVNHSCLPNCVAKVISVRNEKKVVFFAERDIYPGEEITYDYHFSHEDEGKKIPCFCNSKNCRRYLN